MNIRKLCSELAKRENTKSQAKIQAIRSIVGHLSDLIYSEYIHSVKADGYGNSYGDTIYQLIENGESRAKRKKK